MKHRLTAKLKSQRGASLSVALLLFLVCAALCAVVIAAATASSGQFAELGKADQRYYSVISASQLFSDALDGRTPGDTEESETLTFVFEQKKIGSQTIVSNGKPNDVVKVESADISFESPDEKPSRFDFLTSLSNITHYAFCENYSDDEMQEMLKGYSWSDDGWKQPFETKKSLSFSYEVTPDNSFVEAVKESSKITNIQNSDLPVVKVNGELTSDWKLNLDFYNVVSSSGQSNQEYHLNMVLTADVFENDSVSEVFGPTEVQTSPDGSVIVSNTNNITKIRTTTIVWKIEQIVPGKGVSDA